MKRTPTVAVPLLALGLALGLLYGSHVPPAGAEPLHSVATSSPQSGALLTLTSGGDVGGQNGAFKGAGPFTISWVTHRANPGSTNFAFFLNLNSGNIVATHAPGEGSYILHADCSAGCNLAVNVTNVAYTITVSR
jgi:hypothetical protein